MTTMSVLILVFFFFTFLSLHVCNARHLISSSKDVNGIGLEEASTEKLMNKISDLEFDIDYKPPRTHPPGGPPHNNISDLEFDIDYKPPRTHPPGGPPHNKSQSRIVDSGFDLETSPLTPAPDPPNN